MDPSRDPSGTPRSEERMPPPGGWRWKSIDIIALVVLLVVFWPLGLIFLVWKLRNDRKAVPVDLEDVLRDTGTRWDETVKRWTGGAAWSFAGRPGTTGNAAFDAHVARREAEIAAERRALDEEIAEFRRFMDRRRDDADLYEEFRARHARGA